MSDRAVLVVFLAYLALGAGLVIFLLRRHLRRLDDVQSREIDSRSDRDERIGITAIWTNVFALSLISIVGVAQIGVELWRLNLPEKPPSEPALERLPRTGLLDPKIQEQLKEIVAAIREARPPGPIDITGDGIRENLAALQAQVNQLEQAREKPGKTETVLETSPEVSWFFSMVSIFIFSGTVLFCAALGAGVYFLRDKGRISTTVFGALTAVAAAGPLISGIALIKEFSVVKNADSLIKVNIRVDRSQNLAPPAAQPTQLHLHVHHRFLRHSLRRPVSVESDCGTGDAQRIEPFSERGVALEENARIKLKSVVALLKEQSRSRDLLGFVLIGADVEQSQLRIGIVQGELAQTFDPGKFPAMALYAGPSKAGLAPSTKDLAFDAVQICAVWNPRS